MAKVNSTKETAVTTEQSIAKRDATITNMEQLLTVNISDILKAGQAGVTAYIDLGNTINKALHELKPWGYKTVKSIRELFNIDRSKADRALRFANNFELLTTAEGINEAERIIKDSKGPRELTEAEKVAQAELEAVSQPMEGETEEQAMERVADWKRAKRILADFTKIQDLVTHGPKLIKDMVEALESEGIILDDKYNMLMDIPNKTENAA